MFNPKLESTLKGVNKYGIHKIKFSPDGKYIIILGNEHDRAILVYEWKTMKLYSVNRNNRAGLDVEIINYYEEIYVILVGLKGLRRIY